MFLSYFTETLLLAILFALLVLIFERLRPNPATARLAAAGNPTAEPQDIHHPTKAHSESPTEFPNTSHVTAEEAYHPQGHVCFRISNVPSEWKKEDLLRNLTAEGFHPEPQDSDYDLLLFPACSGETNTAILNAVTYSAPFRDITAASTKTVNIRDGPDKVTLSIDRHFYGFTPLNNPKKNIVADVIAVTGLAGHALGSWRNRESGRVWLQDFLPKDLPNIRVMTYGYNTSLTGPQRSDIRMVDHRRDLIQKIQNARGSSQEMDRPIIFIGHSLGGIVILQALLQSKNDQYYRKILRETHAIFFFGVPHGGLRTSELEAMTLDMSNNSESGMLDMLHQLRECSNFLTSQRDDLMGIWDGLKVFSFYETLDTPSVSKSLKTGEYERNGELKKMVKEISALLYLQNERRIPVHQNHTDMVKLSGPADDTYKSVLRCMKECLDNKKTSHNMDVVAESFTDDYVTCLKSLQCFAFESYRDNLWYKRHKHHHPTVLWIDGAPGCGKSVLSSFLSKTIPNHDKLKRFSLAYFFCDDKDERRRTAQAVLANWLAQLLQQIPSLIVHFLAEPMFITGKEKTSWTFGMLWPVILRIIEDPSAGDICLLLDALDECEEGSRTELLVRLQDLINRKHKETNLKIIITSRPHIPVTWYLKDTVQLSLGADDLANDIKLFVDAEIDRLPQLPEKLLEEVRETLIHGANGMFLWVSLILNELNNSKTTKSRIIKQKLKNLPRTLPELYTNILRQIPVENRNDAQNILRWVIWAKRPLTLQELTISVAIQRTHTSMTDILEEMETNMRSVIPKIFGPMLKVEDDNTIQLVHQSARDYFLSPDTLRDPSLSDFHIPCAESHLKIAEACLTYLSFEECGKGTGAQYQEYQPIPQELKFLHYASAYWPEHTHQAYQEGNGQGLPTVFRRLAESPSKIDLAYQIFCSSTHKNFRRTAPLQIVASLGLLQFTSDLLGHGAEVNAQGGYYGGALQAAAVDGNEAVVRLLIERGADVNAQGGYCGNALQAAAVKGNEAMVRLLIERGADVNAQGGDYGNALQAAAVDGNEAVVRLLIERGADVNLQGGSNGVSGGVQR